MKKETKLGFIDTSVFLNCAGEELDGLSFKTLKEIFQEIKDGNLSLLLPQNTEEETLHVIERKFCEIKDGLKENIEKIIKGIKEKNPILENALIESRDASLKKINSKHENAVRIIKKISNSPNTKKIKLTKNILLAGMMRSALKHPPFTNSLNKKSENAHLKDQDCIAFEAVSAFLKKKRHSPKAKIIICANDSDFFETGDHLHKKIKEDLEAFCAEVAGYRSPVSMLKSEFDKPYTEKQEEDYREYQSKNPEPLSALSFDSSFYTGIDMAALTTPRGNELIRVCSKCRYLFIEEAPPFFSLDTPPLFYGGSQERVCPKCQNGRGRSWTEGLLNG